MITAEEKNHILLWMPVMRELEATGRNPVEDMFGPECNIELIEADYKALVRAKEKYPDWWKVVSKLASGIMRSKSVIELTKKEK